MDSVPSTSKADDEKQLQVKLKTTQESFAVPDSTLSVPENVNPEKLNQLLKSLLLDKVETVPEFDFFLSDDLLRSTLGEFIKGNLNSLKKSLLIKPKSFTILLIHLQIEKTLPTNTFLKSYILNKKVLLNLKTVSIMMIGSLESMSKVV